MRTIVVLAVSIVLVSILFCPMVMAAPTMPDGLQIVQPDPSLPKELSTFFGKWQGSAMGIEYFLIVEKIEGEKANLWVFRSGAGEFAQGWQRFEAPVIKEGGKYKLWFQDRNGQVVLTLKGEYLDFQGKITGVRLKRVQ